jgi:DNA-binding GntR family transcriptional regulator
MEESTTMPAIRRNTPLHTKNAHGAAIRLPARELMRDQAYAAIKRFILDGDLAAGAFLAERQLAGQLRMSKTPVRAALQRLETEGFVTISPQQGIIIRDLTVHEIADQYEIRAALESYTLRTLAGRLTPKQVRRVELNLEAQRRLRGSGDVAKGVELDAAFHIQFAEFLGNQEILRVIGQLRDKMQRVVTQVFRVCPARLDTSFDEHAAIAAAVIAGDGARAAELVVQHLELGKQLILSPRG